MFENNNLTIDIAYNMSNLVITGKYEMYWKGYVVKHTYVN